jgi:hypothetical protein
MATPAFKDHFSRQSGDYSRYRPGYPPELVVGEYWPPERRSW